MAEQVIISCPIIDENIETQRVINTFVQNKKISSDCLPRVFPQSTGAAF